jgi:hypothetical protein
MMQHPPMIATLIELDVGDLEADISAGFGLQSTCPAE